MTCDSNWTAVSSVHLDDTTGSIWNHVMFIFGGVFFVLEYTANVFVHWVEF